jgi:hypothetical protein
LDFRTELSIDYITSTRNHYFIKKYPQGNTFTLQSSFQTITQILVKNNLYQFFEGSFGKISMAAVVLLITCILGTVLATGTKKAAFTFPDFQYKESSKNVS